MISVESHLLDMRSMQAADGAGFTCLIRLISGNGSLLTDALLTIAVLRLHEGIPVFSFPPAVVYSPYSPPPSDDPGPCPGPRWPLCQLSSKIDAISKGRFAIEGTMLTTRRVWMRKVDCGSAAFPKERRLGLNSNPTSIYPDVRGPHPARPAELPSKLMQL